MIRRKRGLYSKPTKGFVIDMGNRQYYTKTELKNNTRTNFYNEEPFKAKIFSSEASAKSTITRMSKRMKDEHKKQYATWSIINLDTMLVAAYEIDIIDGGVMYTRAWQEDIDNGYVFASREDAINSEIEAAEKAIISFKESIKSKRDSIRYFKKKLKEWENE